MNKVSVRSLPVSPARRWLSFQVPGVAAAVLLAGVGLRAQTLPAAAVNGDNAANFAPVNTQLAELAPAPPALASAMNEALPDAPGEGVSSSSAAAPAPFSFAAYAAGSASAGALPAAASVHATVIQPGQSAPRLSVGNKITDSFISSVSYTAVAGWLISAGYEQLTNGSPNYGQTGKGFAQRLGAASARATSETVFGNGVIAAVTHEDPRYYRMGPGHNFFKRLVYAGTRPLITRTDGGHKTLNVWDLGGDLAGSALTPVYYPALNRSGTEVLKTFGGSVGGDALGFLASEFLPGILTTLHVEH